MLVTSYIRKLTHACKHPCSKHEARRVQALLSIYHDEHVAFFIRFLRCRISGWGSCPLLALRVHPNSWDRPWAFLGTHGTGAFFSFTQRIISWGFFFNSNWFISTFTEDMGRFIIRKKQKLHDQQTQSSGEDIEDTVCQMHRCVQ